MLEPKDSINDETRRSQDSIHSEFSSALKGEGSFKELTVGDRRKRGK